MDVNVEEAFEVFMAVAIFTVAIVMVIEASTILGASNLAPP